MVKVVSFASAMKSIDPKPELSCLSSTSCWLFKADYFTDLLTRLVNGWPNSRIDELMPWCWAAKNGS